VATGGLRLFEPGAKQACSIGHAEELARCESGGRCLARDGFWINRALLQAGLNPLREEPRKVFRQAGAERQVNMSRGVLGDLDMQAF